MTRIQLRESTFYIFSLFCLCRTSKWLTSIQPYRHTVKNVTDAKTIRSMYFHGLHCFVQFGLLILFFYFFFPIEPKMIWLSLRCKHDSTGIICMESAWKSAWKSARCLGRNLEVTIFAKDQTTRWCWVYPVLRFVIPDLWVQLIPLESTKTYGKPCHLSQSALNSYSQPSRFRVSPFPRSNSEEAFSSFYQSTCFLLLHIPL